MGKGLGSNWSYVWEDVSYGFYLQIKSLKGEKKQWETWKVSKEISAIVKKLKEISYKLKLGKKCLEAFGIEKD